jgi:hypothetical protein
MVQSQPGQIVPETLSGKYPTQNRAGKVPSKHEALSSNSSTTKKNKTQKTKVKKAKVGKEKKKTGK